VEGLAFVYFDESDVVRHHLVQRIIRAYDDHKTRLAEQQMSLSLESKSGDARSAETKAVAPAQADFVAPDSGPAHSASGTPSASENRAGE
jgi:hypothetical protein